MVEEAFLEHGRSGHIQLQPHGHRLPIARRGFRGVARFYNPIEEHTPSPGSRVTVSIAEQAENCPDPKVFTEAATLRPISSLGRVRACLPGKLHRGSTGEIQLLFVDL